MANRSKSRGARHGAAALLGGALVVGLSATLASSAEFSAPAGPLSQTLAAFGRQSGLNVTYLPDVTSGKRSPGFSGAAGPTEALARILAGAGLTWRFVNASTVELLDAAPVQDVRTVSDGETPLQEIGVVGEGGSGGNVWGPVEGIVARRSASATKTGATILETPQTVHVVGRQEFEARGAQSTDEALTYLPGVVANQTYDLRDDGVKLRGFDAQDARYQDGLPSTPGSEFFPIEIYGIEKIEVLKGPASALYGKGEPGGVVDQISKRPTTTPFGELQVQGGSHDRKQGAFDFGGPVPSFGEALSFRLTGLYRDEGSQVDFGSAERVFLAPSVTIKPSDATTLTILAQYQRDRIDGYTAFFLPKFGTLEPFADGRRIPRSRFLGEPGFDHWNTERARVGYQFEHAFSDVWTVRQKLAFTDTKFDQMNSFLTGYVPGTSLINRSVFGDNGRYRSWVSDTHVQAKFATGDLGHTVLAGVDHQSYKGSVQTTFGSMNPIDAFNPVYGQADIRLDPGYAYDMDARQIGAYVQDQIRLGGWALTAGLRRDSAKWKETDTFPDGSPPAIERRDDSATTGRIGLAYLFDNGLAPYASWMTSFNPVTDINFGNPGQPFKPSKAEQYEAGLKYQPPGRDLLMTASVFELTKTNILTDTRAFVQVQLGEARVRGLELEAKATPIKDLNLIASYALSEGVVTKDPVAEGKDVPLVPKHQFALWGDYTLSVGPLAGFGFGAGVRYIGSRFGDRLNRNGLPANTLLDASIKYAFQPDTALAGASLQVSASNLLDKTFVSECSSRTSCFYGPGRMVTATMTYRW